MPSNPLVPQGTLNRLRGSVVFGDNPNLNITAGFLAKNAISIAFENDSGELLPTLTGGVTSPEPYQIAVVTMNLLKSQGLADIYKRQIESSVNVGSVDVIPDANTLSNYTLENCILLAPRSLDFSGTSPDFTVTLRGIYYINNSLWGL